MSFDGVVADASKHPAQISGTISYLGTVRAKGVTIHVKTSEDFNQAIGDMAPGSKRQFTIYAAADSATYSMGVAWHEGGSLGWKEYLAQ